MTVCAYVDGSYLDGRVGYGALLLEDGETQKEFSGSVHEHTDAHQVAGELVATMQVLEYCHAHHISHIEIYYDYLGIEMWATGKWKTNTTLTREYARFINQSPVKIRWKKVKSHSGNTHNDRADELAKQGALGAEKEPSSQKNEQIQQGLAVIAQTFCDQFSLPGLEAHFEKVQNNQYARILIEQRGKRIGFFDLYDTKKRKLDPYLHGFSNKKTQHDIQEYWEDFKQTL